MIVRILLTSGTEHSFLVESNIYPHFSFEAHGISVKEKTSNNIIFFPWHVIYRCTYSAF